MTSKIGHPPASQQDTRISALVGGVGRFGVERLDLHNQYNAAEVVVLTLGFWDEAEKKL